MYKLVLIRHGQSVWNKKNLFTGWVDVDLTEQGRQEATQAGQLLVNQGFEFDVAYTSVLKRAIKTLNIVLDEMDLHWIPVHKSWRLNEKSYGALAGLNKAETAEKYGEDQVLKWRRSYDVRPPELPADHDYHPVNDRRYGVLSDDEKTAGESLKDTVKRIEPVWQNQIAPAIKSGKRIIIAAHGNSLRAIIKTLDNLSEDQILKVNVPTGTPLVYELDESLTPVKHYYLGDQSAIEAQMKAVANQAKSQ